MTRLSDEAVLIDLAEAVFHYYVRAHDPRAAAAVALLQSEHIYYKHSTVSAAVQRSHAFNQVWGKYSDIHPASTGRAVKVQTAFNASTIHPASVSGPPTVEFTVVDYEEKLSFLCQFIFKHGDERTKTRALLFSVYNHSLHDRYYIARDLFLMSHIQDNIDKVEASTQILYNRTLVTLGLCAFRHGFIQKAHDCLAGICAGRIKDLLAQGSVFKHYDRDPEQEKLERRRQMPYHLHINPELLEAVHMICAMILELPHLSKPGSTQFVSKPFRKYFQGYSRQVFNGPPESVRDHVLLATKSILAGEWQTGRDVLLQLEVWKLVPGDGAAKIREVLLTKVKEEAIKSYLLTYGQYYESIGIAYVAEIFETDAATVKRIASRLIFGKDLSAALDQQANLITLYTVESSSLQSLTQQLTEKVVLLVESNERLIDPILNVYNFNPKDEWRGGERKHDQTDRRRFQSGFRAARPVGGRGYNGSRNSKAGRGATGPQKSVWGKGKPGIKSQ